MSTRGIRQLFPSAGIEYYYYDQLGLSNSDQPDEPELWDLRASLTRSSRCARRSAYQITSTCLALLGGIRRSSTR